MWNSVSKNCLQFNLKKISQQIVYDHLKAKKLEVTELPLGKAMLFVKEYRVQYQECLDRGKKKKTHSV